MNKRDFLIHGTGALLGAAATTSAARAAVGPSSDEALGIDGVRVVPAMGEASTSQQARWQALQGERFTSHTPLGRPLELVLSEVCDGPACRAPHASDGMEQFTVSFEGPRALPLQAGLYQLTHPTQGSTALYLEPVAHGERIGYDAHFSLIKPDTSSMLPG